MSATDAHHLSDGPIVCRVAPHAGGRLASVSVHGTAVLVTGDDTGDGDEPTLLWGCYPMAPYAGRVRSGRFDHDGVTLEVPVTLGGNAIHGTTYLRPWTVVSSSANSLEMRIDLGDEWPLGGYATHRVTVTASTLRCELSVTAADRSMPAQVGWHPWFVKPIRARLRFSGMYETDGSGLPTGEVVTVPPGPWDDCFVDPLGAPEITIPGAHGTPDVTVTLTSDCRHWVVYDRPDHATCIEPQSGPPDGFTVEPLVLAPGATLRRSMEWSFETADDDSSREVTDPSTLALLQCEEEDHAT